MRRWLLILAPALLGAGALFLGCQQKVTPPPVTEFTVYAPCVIGSPMQRVVHAYRKLHPEAQVQLDTDKPIAMLANVQQERTAPGVALTMGEKEMQSLVQAGAVEPSRIVPFGQNAYRLAIIVPAENTSVQKLGDLAKVTKLAIDDPTVSTLGARAQQAFIKLGLWDKVATKVVHFDATDNVISQLRAGKAEAVVVFQNCLLEGGSAPRTVRIVGTLPEDAYDPIIYQAAPLGAPTPTVQSFLDYLTSPEGKKELQTVGLLAK